MIRARHFVASSLNPHQTFLDLLDPEVLACMRFARKPNASSTI